jgi:hypothetical protein
MLNENEIWPEMQTCPSRVIAALSRNLLKKVSFPFFSFTGLQLRPSMTGTLDQGAPCV